MAIAILHPRFKADIETVRRAYNTRRKMLRTATFLERFGGGSILAGRKYGLSVDGSTMRDLMQEYITVDPETNRQFDKSLALPKIRATVEQKNKMLEQLDQAIAAGQFVAQLRALAKEPQQ